MKRVRKMKICDNVDCEGDYKNDSELHKVKMREEFEGGVVTWCENCIKRDENFVEEILD